MIKQAIEFMPKNARLSEATTFAKVTGISLQERNEVAQMSREGKTSKEIAEWIGISCASVSSIRKQYGIQVKRGRRIIGDAEQIETFNLVKKYGTLYAAAVASGKEYSVLANRLIRYVENQIIAKEKKDMREEDRLRIQQALRSDRSFNRHRGARICKAHRKELAI